MNNMKYTPRIFIPTVPILIIYFIAAEVKSTLYYNMFQLSNEFVLCAYILCIRAGFYHSTYLCIVKCSPNTVRRFDVAKD